MMKANIILYTDFSSRYEPKNTLKAYINLSPLKYYILKFNYFAIIDTIEEMKLG